MKTKGKIVTALAVCALVAVGATVLFFRLKTDRIEPMEVIRLSAIDGIDAQEIVLTAHRGMSAIEPENTLPAIKAACDGGFAYVEFDIRPTLDGRWVLMHDDSLRRTTNALGNVSDKTYEELQKYDIDNGANIENYTSLKIPSLESVMELMEPFYPATRPMIEIKDADEQSLVALIDIIKEYEAAGMSAVIISFDIQTLIAIKAQCPGQTYWYLTSKLSDEALEHCRENGMWAAFNGNDRDNSLSRINAFLQADIPLACWTIDSPQTVKELYDAGVRYITTNCIIP